MGKADTLCTMTPAVASQYAAAGALARARRRNDVTRCNDIDRQSCICQSQCQSKMFNVARIAELLRSSRLTLALSYELV